MICVVLAAGYATRLYPLTENFPKPLLKVREKAILDWLLDDMDGSFEISQYVIVSNHKFKEHFDAWAAGKRLSSPVTVLDDGSVSNETRLGAVRDIQLAIESLNLNDDLLVIAGDNVLDFTLQQFIAYAKAHQAPCVMRYDEQSIERLRKAGVAEVDETDRITRMEEKPAEPFAHWCIPPFYFYPQKALHYVADAINAGCNTDAPGSFIAWLSYQTPVYAMQMSGRRYDIGNLQSYQAVRENYQGIMQ